MRPYKIAEYVLKTKKELLTRAQLIISGVREDKIYPRTALEVVHMVTFEGVTWQELEISADALTKLFETAWSHYAKVANSQVFFVLEDFKTQVRKSLMPEHEAGVDAEIYHIYSAETKEAA